MKKYLLAIIGGLGLAAAISLLLEVSTRPIAAQDKPFTAQFDSDGKMKRPTGYRGWVFVGAPLTPNGLNNGKANFPEFHHGSGCAENAHKATFHFYEFEERRRCRSNRKLCH